MPRAEEAVSWPYTSDAFDPEIGHVLYEAYLSQLAYCEELGYDAVAVNEHHYSAYGLVPNPNLVAANLATRTDEVDIAVYGNVLPLRDHPVRVAELERQHEAIGGFDTLIALLQFGSLPDDLTRKNLELFADEVVPRLRRLA